MFQPLPEPLLTGPRFEGAQHIGVTAAALGGILHLQDDIVEEVRQVEDDLVLLLMTAGAKLQQRAEEQPVDGDDSGGIGGWHGYSRSGNIERSGVYSSTGTVVSGAIELFCPVETPSRVGCRGRPPG